MSRNEEAAEEREGVLRIGVSLPANLLREFDEIIGKIGYTSRSKALADAIRDFIDKYHWLREEEETVITGALTLIYTIEKRNLPEEILEIQHKYEDVISASMHIHLDESRCLEILAIRGSRSRIKKLAEELSAKKGVEQVKVITTYYRGKSHSEGE
ncbi:MAG: nickel-responsive transcriptional regulator NikR [Candidatus Baldrarchaeia archaeon]